MSNDIFGLAGVSGVSTPTPVNIAPQSQVDAAEQAQQEDADKSSMWDLIGADASQQTIGLIDHTAHELSMPVDPGWTLPTNFESDMKRLHIDPKYWSIFDRAHSQQHYEYLQDIAIQAQGADEERAKHGMFANIVAGAVDPGMVAVDTLASPLAFSAQAGRIGNAIRAGLLAAGENTALEVAESHYDPTIDYKQMATDAALGFALGGTLGLRAGEIAKLDQASRKLSEAIAARNDSMGAARVSGANPELDDIPGRNPTQVEEDRLAQALSEGHIKAAFANQRFSVGAFFAKSPSALVRMVGRKLVRESVGFTDHNIAVEQAASELSKQLSFSVMSKWNAAAADAFKAWRKETGASILSPSSRTKFMEQLGRAMRGDVQDVPDSVRALVGPTNEAFKKTLGELKRYGVTGFDNVEHVADWLPRKGSRGGIEDIFHTKKLSFEDVRDQLIAPAMKRAWLKRAEDEAARTGEPARTIDDNTIKTVAGAWIKRMREKTSAIRGFQGDGVGVYDIDGIKKTLVDSGIDEAHADEIVSKFETRNVEKSMHSHAKHRIDMDESFRADVTDSETGITHNIGVADLLENDVQRLLADYTREMSGWAALAAKVDVKTPAELEGLYQQMQREAEKAGYDAAGVDKVRRYTELAVHSILGRSTEANPDKWVSRAARMLRDHAYLTTMGQMGYTMLAELGPTMAYAGFRNTIRSVAHAGELYRRMKDGSLASRDAQALEFITGGIGSDFNTFPPYLRADEPGWTPWSGREGSLGAKAAKAVNAVDNTQVVLKRGLSYLSGMHPVQDFLMRISARASMYRLTELANKARLSGAEVRRLRNWGMTEEMQKAIFARLKGVDANIAEAQFETWPVEEREALSAYMWRVTHHQVLEGDVGDSIGLQHSTEGKILTQFRAFMIHSYEAHFLNSFHMWRDWRTWAMWTTSSFFAALGYSARAYLNTIGDPEKRQKMLSPSAIFWNGAVQQSSWSSFVPGAIDTARAAVGYDSLFNFGRTTGLDTAFDLNSIPAVNSVRNALKTTPILAHALRPDQKVTSSDVRSMWHLLWLNNVTGVRLIGDEAARLAPPPSANAGTKEMFPEDN